MYCCSFSILLNKVGDQITQFIFYFRIVKLYIVKYLYHTVLVFITAQPNFLSNDLQINIFTISSRRLYLMIYKLKCQLEF